MVELSGPWDEDLPEVGIGVGHGGLGRFFYGEGYTYISWFL